MISTLPIKACTTSCVYCIRMTVLYSMVGTGLVSNMGVASPFVMTTRDAMFMANNSTTMVPFHIRRMDTHFWKHIGMLAFTWGRISSLLVP